MNYFISILIGGVVLVVIFLFSLRRRPDPFEVGRDQEQTVKLPRLEADELERARLDNIRIVDELRRQNRIGPRRVERENPK